MPLVVREASREDAGDLAHLVTELGYPVDPAEFWPRVEKMPSALYRTLVAANETRVVGFIGLLTLPVYEHARPVGWILALCVALDHQGQGISTALVTAAETYYQRAGVIDIRLHSGLHRDGAHRFYEKMGFDKSGYRFKKRLS